MNIPEFPGLFCKDRRIYILTELINSILAGAVLTDAHKETLKDFPNCIEVLEYFAQKYKDKTAPIRMHFTPGPEAELEAFAAEILRIEKEIESGNFEEFHDLDSVFKSM